MLACRLQVAEMLVNGLTYDQIQRKLSVGTSTVQGVDRWLTDAAHEYRLIRDEKRQELRTSRKRQQQEQRRTATTPGALGHLVQHDQRFILFRLLLGGS